MDLGADGWQTFRYVTLPADLDARSSRRALLAFALSFDEVIVTIVHRRRAEHAADLDLRQHPAPADEQPVVNVVVVRS